MLWYSKPREAIRHEGTHRSSRLVSTARLPAPAVGLSGALGGERQADSSRCRRRTRPRQPQQALDCRQITFGNVTLPIDDLRANDAVKHQTIQFAIARHVMLSSRTNAILEHQR